ncbi:hypothetical protein C5167_030770 [Papaver somniferum]|nr:hypothetical protein C5167_030770 [Papaver somniferum]
MVVISIKQSRILYPYLQGFRIRRPSPDSPSNKMTSGFYVFMDKSIKHNSFCEEPHYDLNSNIISGNWEYGRDFITTDRSLRTSFYPDTYNVNWRYNIPDAIFSINLQLLQTDVKGLHGMIHTAEFKGDEHFRPYRYEDVRDPLYLDLTVVPILSQKLVFSILEPIDDWTLILRSSRRPGGNRSAMLLTSCSAPDVIPSGGVILLSIR